MAASIALRKILGILNKTAFSRPFSQLTTSRFETSPLHKRLIDRLGSLNAVKLTEIQQKSLGPVLRGENVIINSETGSGKTLCYLLPIINKLLMEIPTKKSSPSALILVPNMHLGFQITEVFNQLCDPGLFACPVHREMALRISEKYPVIISTPHTLSQYNIPLLSATLTTVVIDEADMVIANGGKTLWKLLNNLKNPSQLRYNNVSKIQFIFVAATMPRRGEKSVLRKITKWAPGVLHVTSSSVHRYVPTVHTLDIATKEDEKLSNLMKYLNILTKNNPVSEEMNDSCVPREEVELIEKLSQHKKHLKILVFVNTVSKARKVFQFINYGEDENLAGKIYEDDEETFVYPRKTTENAHIRKTFLRKTKEMASWNGKVGLLHKEIDLSERQGVLEKFKRNQIVVLICTDLGSRGLDIPDVSHVIQVDYAHNAVDVLHRAGRTARAGAEGTVINFITEKDKELMEAVKRNEKEHEGFQNIFSRNRMFSRRINKNNV